MTGAENADGNADAASATSPHVRFAVALVVVTAFLQVLAVLLLPPDPYSQLFFFAPIFGFGFLVAYWLAYRGGFDRLRP
ncbi:MAG: hypothetical protein ABEJ82_08905 [Haloplanus sp.]